jgi:hypothetical protein
LGNEAHIMEIREAEAEGPPEDGQKYQRLKEFT